MRRTITQSALVFASVLLIIALAGCGGSSKKTPVVMPGGGGGNGGGGGTDPATSAPNPITLPSGSMLRGTTNIDAGDITPIPGTYSKGRTSAIMCPDAAGDAGCVVTVTATGATATGGATVVPGSTNQMVWQANNGPDGTSNGRHAVAIAKRLVGSTSLGTAIDTEMVSGVGEGSEQRTIEVSTPPVYPVPSVMWTSGTAPKVELTLDTKVFSAIPSTSLGTDPGKLMVDSASTPPTLAAGWGGTALSKDTSNAKTVHAVVYTDIAKPTNSKPKVPFGEDLDLSAYSSLTTAVSGSGPISSNVEFTIPSSGSLTEIKVTMMPTVAMSLRGGGALTGEYSVSINYKDSQGRDQSREDAKMTCARLICRVAGGQLLGEWNIEAPLVPGTQDPVFMTLGSWAVVPDNPASVSDVQLGAFAYGKTGSGALDRVNVGFLDNQTSGDIQYKGSATGFYVKGSYSGATTPAITAATAGSFVADVNLTASVGNTGTDDSFTGVSGTINNFKENGVSLPNWIMGLGSTALVTGTSDDNNEVLRGIASLETAEGHSASGIWTVGLYYDTTLSAGQRINHALGTFNAGTSHSDPVDGEATLNVVGAFGAKHTP